MKNNELKLVEWLKNSKMVQVAKIDLTKLSISELEEMVELVYDCKDNPEVMGWA